MATTIRLTLTDQLQKGMEELQQRYPFMKLDEIVKMALSRLYKSDVSMVRDEGESYSALQDKLLKTPGGVNFKNEEAMSKWWMKNKKKLRGK